MIVTASPIVIPMTVSSAYNVIEAELYKGDYEITPTENVQILSTDGLLMKRDVTIYAIVALTEQEIHDAVAAGWV